MGEPTPAPAGAPTALWDTMATGSGRSRADLFDNQLFTGGLGLAVLGAMANLFRSGGKVAATLARRHFLMTLEVTNRDRSYPWVLQWVVAQSQKAGAKRVQHLSVETVTTEVSPGNVATKFGMTPGPGRHLMQFKGRWLRVTRDRETATVMGASGPFERIQFMTIGRDPWLLEELLADARDMATQHEEGKTVVYTNWGREWKQFGSARPRRPITSVVLDDGIAQRLLADVEDWRSSRGWYSKRGIPYRRGYLLHGSPGSGKSSFIMALAGHFRYNICILNLSEPGLTDDRLAFALSVVPPGSLVLLEDIDAAFVRRDQTDQSASWVSFSGLLNVLDGVAASEERLLFMTTNHIERLDPALIRPGRVDVVEALGNSSAHQRRALFRTFYESECDADPGLPAEFEQQVAAHGLEGSLSMAQLQGYFLLFKHSAREAVGNVGTTLRDQVAHHQPRPEEPELAGELAKVQQANLRTRPPGKRITAYEMDKMLYNPQDGIESTFVDLDGGGGGGRA